ncbi:hypothetical protein STCU_11922 [Strigomonas culicis]|uniref:Uncharacterized protein n=1 Tax=Strigomonas culicis TaxID=28005 RepID=S9TGX2_9TRYP|nr:hypothetical protein STCU_11922 [Strigomonas culicis]|eukprot:EPY15573.1 hypothetical protein STCU_11922 [Strigomonas culicis]
MDASAERRVRGAFSGSSRIPPRPRHHAILYECLDDFDGSTSMPALPPASWCSYPPWHARARRGARPSSTPVGRRPQREEPEEVIWHAPPRRAHDAHRLLRL